MLGFNYAGGQLKKGTKRAFDVLMADKEIVQMCKMYGVRMMQFDPEVHA